MNFSSLTALTLLGCLGAATVTATYSTGSRDDARDLPRERGGANDEIKDALEGKLAPALQVRGWMNTDALELKDLRGKVVLLKFWGVW